MNWFLYDNGIRHERVKDIKCGKEIITTEREKEQEKEQEKEIGRGFSSQDYYCDLDPKGSLQLSFLYHLFNIEWIGFLNIFLACWLNIMILTSLTDFGCIKKGFGAFLDITKMLKYVSTRHKSLGSFEYNITTQDWFIGVF